MEEYYLNNSKCCAKLPTRSSDYLQQSNFLSEFGTKDDKQEARDNLGITGLLDELKSLIDNKIIRYGGVAWDLKPIQGHSDRVLSSDAIYKTLLDYATEKELNSKITSLWSLILNKIDDLEQRINSYTENGVALSNKFGDSETIGVSQKAFYIGSGSTWNEVENVVNLRDLNSLGKYDVRVNRDGDFIFVIVDNSEAQNIIMLDNVSTGQPSIEMNGMLIPMTTEVDNLRGLTIYKSKNRYQIGGYPITINYEQQD